MKSQVKRPELRGLVEKAVDRILSAGKMRKSDAAPIDEIPISVSNRHIHLSQESLDILFGRDYRLTPIRELSQPGQFAAEETVTLATYKSSISGIRILGPIRSITQAEITISDSYGLGIFAPVRLSGNTAGSAGGTIIGPKGAVTLDEGIIVALRHIHITPADADRFNVKNGDCVSVEVSGVRGLVFTDVVIRVSEKSKLDMHIDTDEANAAGCAGGMEGRIVQASKTASNLSPNAEPEKKDAPPTGRRPLVCSDDVLRALALGGELVVPRHAIITQEARDIARYHGLFKESD